MAGGWWVLVAVRPELDLGGPVTDGTSHMGIHLCRPITPTLLPLALSSTQTWTMFVKTSEWLLSLGMVTLTALLTLMAKIPKLGHESSVSSECLCRSISTDSEYHAVYACSIAAQCSHAAFPTFTGPQIEARLASIEEELTARKREHARRSQETEELWFAYKHAADEFRDVERKVEELDETLKLLQDLRAIALIHFPPVPGQT